jgi:Inner membrane protein YgaP-like, transmembrane domain
MKTNLGVVDRVLRVVIGLVLVAWVLLASGPTWAWLGIVPLFTGIINFCPLYRLLGINSCNSK